MRCLALSQAWKEAVGHVTFLKTADVPALDKRLVKEEMSVRHLLAEPGSERDALETAQLARELGATWVVLDGYHFGSNFHKRIKDAGLRLCMLDDLGGSARYVADVIINQNIYATESLYPHRAPYTTLLLGTKYALLRKEFSRWRDWRRDVPEKANKILVTLGGSDPENVTIRILKALNRLHAEDVEVHGVIGTANVHAHELEEFVASSQIKIQLLQNVEEMSEVMAWADVAISAAGSTCWELAFMGVPSVVVVLAENQSLIAKGLHAAGSSISLGWHGSLQEGLLQGIIENLINDQSLRMGMSRKARVLVDGNGAARVVAILMPEYQ